MKHLTKSFRDIGFLTIALTMALAANFAYGQWANPTASAPNNNVAAPINVSTANQTKTGNITAWRQKAGNQMWSPEYCDESGQNCFQAAEVNSTPPPSTPTVTYSWSTGGWGSCSGACGTSGTQSRSVQCRSSQGGVVGDGQCSGSKPTQNKSCTNASCSNPPSVTYSWTTGGWGSCSGSCGTNGTRYRSVQCRSSQGALVGDGQCSGSKPSQSTSCTNSACTPPAGNKSCAATLNPQWGSIPNANHGRIVTVSQISNGRTSTWQCDDGTWIMMSSHIDRK